MTDLGEEWEISEIIDERKRGHSRQYLVRWRSHRTEDEHWLPGRELEDAQALDDWIALKERAAPAGDT